MKKILFIILVLAGSTIVFAQTDAKESVPAEKVHNVVETMPHFPGCEDEEERKRSGCAQQRMLQFIYGQLKYPADARYKRTEGTVVVKFVVGSNGEVRDVSVVKSLRDGCDEEAVRVVKEMPIWIPGILNKKHVAVNYKLPIRFKLQ
ncbi:MAG: protein TonB [Polaribacter sp.]|jgi:protein TonB